MPSFVNTVNNVRIEKNLIFFTFGSVGPGKNSEAEFIPCSDIVMRVEDACEMFNFLIHKTNPPIAVPIDENKDLQERDIKVIRKLLTTS